MSASEEEDESMPQKGWHMMRSPWTAPAIAFGLMALLLQFAGDTVDRLEFLWYDSGLRTRLQLGLAEPLDDTIRFFELGMNDEIARRYADDGEYKTAAGILETLAQLGTKVVALDIVYAFGKEDDQKYLADTIRRIESETSTKVVAPVIIENPEIIAKRGGDKLIFTAPKAGGRDLKMGVVNVEIDSDKLWRKYRYTHLLDGETYPSLPLAAFSASRPSILSVKPVEGEPGVMQWKETTEDGKIFTRWVDNNNIYLNLPYSYYNTNADPIAGTRGRAWDLESLEELAEQSKAEGLMPLEGTIVFVGYASDFDLKPTPHHEQDPGMFLHGVALHDIIHDTGIRRLPKFAELVVYFLAALLAGLLFSLARQKRVLILVVALGIVSLALSGWLLVWFAELFIPAMGACSVWGLSVFGEVGRRWADEQRERTRRDAMLGFYFSPAVLKQVTQNLDMIRPQGNDVAILLSDLRGFTTLCESQKVERVFELLNRMFGLETRAALKENGSLARFAGDQFLSYWGAPEGCVDAADRALRAALTIQEELKERREAPDADELDSWLRIGVGLHFGRGLVGHVGSRDYRDYNIVGDSVNTTARVEGQTKNYLAPIIATGDFIDALSGDPPSGIYVDHVRVKGRHKPVKMYAIFLPGEEAEPEAVEAYVKAFSRYERGAFGEARKAFERLEADPHPVISASATILAERCALLEKEPPKDWEGVYELLSK